MCDYYWHIVSIFFQNTKYYYLIDHVMKPSQNLLIVSHLSEFPRCKNPGLPLNSPLCQDWMGCRDEDFPSCYGGSRISPSCTPDGRSIGPVLFGMLAYFHLYYKRLTFLQKSGNVKCKRYWHTKQQILNDCADFQSNEPKVQDRSG